MNNIVLDYASKLDNKELANLSKIFYEENCCNGMVCDDEDYFKDKKIVVAKLNNKIIGYAYGSVEKQEKDKSYIKAGELSFYLDEMYVLKQYRSLGVGKLLFDFIEKEAKEKGCKLILLNAVSKDYKKLLKFYIDLLGFEFWSAFLLKKI